MPFFTDTNHSNTHSDRSAMHKPMNDQITIKKKNIEKSLANVMDRQREQTEHSWACTWSKTSTLHSFYCQLWAVETGLM